MKTPLRVVTLCSGYDSQCLALQRLADRFPGFSYQLIAWSEDPAAIRAHNALFPEAASRNLGDMSKIDWSKVPNFDLLTYSTPCTDVSSAGQQKGVAEGSGTRSSLLWLTRNAILAKRPKYLLMENVEALVQKKFLPYFIKWQNELARYGYSNFAKVLNATDYGVPQNRRRIFMVSILDPEARFYFPEPFPLTRRLKDVLEDNVDESFYLSDERVQGLIKSTLKEREAGRGFEFQPKTEEQTASTLTSGCTTRKTDNFLVVNECKENGGGIAKTVTSHYAKEKTSDISRGAFGAGSMVMSREALSVRQIANISQRDGRRNPNQGRVYDTGGLSPTLNAHSGGNLEPIITEDGT